MATAFLTLPFSSSTGRVLDSGSKDFVELAEVEAAIANRSAILIDARPEFQFELGHIPSAVSIPYDTERLADFIAHYSLRDEAVIVYCSSSHCNSADILAEKLRANGRKRVAVYAGGWEEWRKRRKGEGVKMSIEL
jgi:rhodanese-related sulfurtransferase